MSINPRGEWQARANLLDRSFFLWVHERRAAERRRGATLVPLLVRGKLQMTAYYRWLGESGPLAPFSRDQVTRDAWSDRAPSTLLALAKMLTTVHDPDAVKRVSAETGVKVCDADRRWLLRVWAHRSPQVAYDYALALEILRRG